jgi:hypothetical protein
MMCVTFCKIALSAGIEVFFAIVEGISWSLGGDVFAAHEVVLVMILYCGHGQNAKQSD